MTWFHLYAYPLSLGAYYVLRSLPFPCQSCRDSYPLGLPGSVSGITSTWIAEENRDNPGKSSSSLVVLKTLQTTPTFKTHMLVVRGPEFELWPE